MIILTKRINPFILFLTFLIILFISTSIQAQKNSASTNEVIPGQYIVGLKTEAMSSSIKNMEGKSYTTKQSIMRDHATSMLSSINMGTLNILNVYSTAAKGFVVSGLTEADAERLRKDSRVAYVEQDIRVSLESTNTTIANGNSITNNKKVLGTNSGLWDNMPPICETSLIADNVSYVHVQAQFGPIQFDVTGEIVLVVDDAAPTSDGCSAITNNVAGKIVLIDRGICEFGFKALTAQNAGAVGVIIANNIAGPPQTMAPGLSGASVTIPVMSISLADGNAVKTALLGGPINGTLQNQIGQAGQCLPWGITRVGGGITTAVGKRAWIIDSGIDLDHPDLNVNTALSTFFAGTDPNDENGHGTHVAGTVAAINNSIGVVGVAPGTEVVSVRVFGATGGSDASIIIMGIDYVAANAGPNDVVNMSLGGGAFLPTDYAILAASAVCKFVLSSGNDGFAANNNSPGRVNGPNIYTVSAMAEGDTWASFSNFGNPSVDFCAPGVGVISCYRDAQYFTLNGTSMAAPHVTGLLLLGDICGSTFVTGDPDGIPDPIAVLDQSADVDNDGYSVCEGDCDDNNDMIYPEAAELCNSIDDNCDGLIEPLISLHISVDIPKIILTTPNTITSTLTLSGFTENILDLNIKNLDIDHTYVGDLNATLTSPGGIVVSLFHETGSPSIGGGCPNANIFASFDDEVLSLDAAFETTCSDGSYAIAGTYRSQNSLSAFDGVSPNGVWTLTVNDPHNVDGGSLNGWGLELSTIQTEYTTAASGPYNDPNTWAGCPPPNPVPSGTTVNVLHALSNPMGNTVTNNGIIMCNTPFINLGTYQGNGTLQGSFVNQGLVKPGDQ